MATSTTAQAEKWDDGTTDYVPTRAVKSDWNSKKPHVSTEPWTLSNWYRKINWINTTFVIFIPFSGLIAAYWTPLHRYTAIWAVVYYFNTGLGITGGYHRLWSHCSYKATLPLRLYLAAVGAGAVEGSIRWWSRGHRAHHRYTDTLKDPYSVRKGLMYSHMSWMILKQDSKAMGRTDISDLNEDAVVRFQHLHYVKIALFFAFIFPAAVAGLGWGDWVGGLVYAGLCRTLFVQQATFCVNSLAHWLGDQPFDDRNSPRDHFITALVTLGEGYHNFHHEFPYDYRNGAEYHSFDPTKWLIWALSYVGGTYHLMRFDKETIEKGKLQMLEKEVVRRRELLHWGPQPDTLPEYTMEKVQEEFSKGEQLIVVDGFVHDVRGFIDEHPAGSAIVKPYLGKDASAAFNGLVYNHSNAARNIIDTLRIGKLVEKEKSE